jgi:hypothetical protein
LTLGIALKPVTKDLGEEKERLLQRQHKRMGVEERKERKILRVWEGEGGGLTRRNVRRIMLVEEGGKERGGTLKLLTTRAFDGLCQASFWLSRNLSLHLQWLHRVLPL